MTIPKLGFVNFHAAPLPELKGGDPFTIGINNKSIGWGVTAHYMDENYDTGPIIRVKKIPLNEYIDLCLYKLKSSYYEKKNIFGPRGDFITSPYVSSIFVDW